VGSEEDWGRLREEMERTTCVRLPGFLHPDFLRQIQALVARTDFEPFDHGGLGVDEQAIPGRLAATMSLVLNDLVLRQAVARILGCETLSGFEGRVYRLLPGARGYDPWHSDAGRNRVAALSVNLQDGGEHMAPLQIRRRDSEVILHEVVNATPGDAVLFRVHPDYVHRVKYTPEAGVRLACAGWFYRGGDFVARLRGSDPDS
jgi:hypothetical protein